MLIKIINYKFFMGIGDWGLGIGDWGLGSGGNPQSPIPNPQSPRFKLFFIIKNKNYVNKLNYILK